MNQAEAIEEISKALSHLTYQVAQENFAGFFSKNSLLEDLLLPALAIVLQTPALRNLNAMGHTNAFLDLGDDEARVGVQVTTEDDAAKVTKTLEGVLNSKLYDKYDRIVIFILRAVRPRFAKKTKDAWTAAYGTNLAFIPERDIISLPQLLSLIKARPFSEITKIQELFSHTGSTAGQPYLYYILSSTQSGLLTVTMNISGTYTDAQVSYAEFPHTANCTVAHDVDSSLGSGSTGTSITSPSITPSAPGELLFGFTAVESHATAIGSPWSCLENYGPSENSSCFDGTTVNAWTYILSGASGATANNVTQLNSDPWQALLTSFSLTGSGVVRRRRAWVIQSN